MSNCGPSLTPAGSVTEATSMDAGDRLLASVGGVTRRVTPDALKKQMREVVAYDDLDALTVNDVPTDAHIKVLNGGAILQGVASGETITTAGGAKLVVVRGPEFNTRSATTLGEIAKYPDGTIGYAAGNQYTANSSLAGASSDGNDVGVDGIEATGPLSGGLAGAVLAKASGDEFDTEWRAVQSSLTDTTTDALMQVGAFGLGGTGAAPIIADLNNLTGVGSGFYQIDQTYTANRPAGVDYASAFVWWRNANNPHVLILTNFGRLMYRPSSSGAYGAWQSAFMLSDLPSGLTDGDILYRDSGAWARLPKGTDGQVLSLSSGLPAWAAAGGESPVKAWVNFNGTGAVAILASKNVSSITDNGTGDWTVNFSSALEDANYAVGGMNCGIDANRQLVVKGDATGVPTLKTTSACRIVSTIASSGVPYDAASVSLIFTR